MKRLAALVVVGLLLGSVAFAGEVKVINPKAAFPEGPVWHDGKLYYVEYGAHTVMTWDGGKNDEFWRQEGCGPSAVVPTESKDFLVTCYDSNTIVRISADGKTIATHDKDKDGQPLIGPNDFVADKKGGVYFSASGPWETAPIVGKIFYINSDGIVSEVANDIHYANGLALSLNGKTLYCAESEAHRIIQFTVGKDGTLSDRRLFVRVGEVDAKSGLSAFPDGLKTDSKGNLYIAQFSAGRIVVVTSEGKLLRTIDVPSPSAPNLNFGPDEDAVYIMAVDDANNAPYYGKVYQVPNK
jgi:sugar lactone lactonase YvrE